VLEFCDPRVSEIRKMVTELLDFEVGHHSLLLYGTCRGYRTTGQCSQPTT
jgi:Fur family ferric uptake transcriptional regulator